MLPQSSNRGCRWARRRSDGRTRHQRSCNRDALLLSPESSDGRWPRRSARARLLRGHRGTPWPGLFPASESGRTMFSSAVSIGSRLKNWKMKPMCRRRTLVTSLSLSSPSRVTAIVTWPEVGRSGGEDVHQRRLARARGAASRGRLSECDIERDAAKGVDGRVALAIATGDFVRCDDSVFLRRLDARLPAPASRAAATLPHRGCGKLSALELVEPSSATSRVV